MLVSWTMSNMKLKMKRIRCCMYGMYNVCSIIPSIHSSTFSSIFSRDHPSICHPFQPSHQSVLDPYHCFNTAEREGRSWLLGEAAATFCRCQSDFDLPYSGLENHILVHVSSQITLMHRMFNNKEYDCIASSGYSNISGVDDGQSLVS